MDGSGVNMTGSPLNKMTFRFMPAAEAGLELRFYSKYANSHQVRERGCGGITAVRQVLPCPTRPSLPLQIRQVRRAVVRERWGLGQTCLSCCTTTCRTPTRKRVTLTWVDRVIRPGDKQELLFITRSTYAVLAAVLATSKDQRRHRHSTFALGGGGGGGKGGGGAGAAGPNDSVQSRRQSWRP